MRIVHKSKGYAALLKHPNVMNDLKRRAERIAAATDDQDVVVEPSDPIHTRNRVAIVAPKGDPENSILRNLDEGR